VLQDSIRFGLEPKSSAGGVKPCESRRAVTARFRRALLRLW